MVAQRSGRDKALRGLLFACVVAVLAAMLGWWVHDLTSGLSQASNERDRAKLAQSQTQQLAETGQALKQEREKAESLARDLAATRRELETQAAALKKAGDRTAETQQLTEVRQALQDERGKAEGLARELTAARREIETQAVA